MRFLPLLVLAACAIAARLPDDRGPGIEPDRRGAERIYAARDFDGVALGNGAQMQVRVGPDWSVRATGPDAAFRDLRVSRDSRTLAVGRRYRGERGNPDLERQIRIYITLPQIHTVALGGPGAIRIDKVAGERFDAALGGSGLIDVARIDVRRGEMSIGGSGRIAAAGRVDTLKVNLGGSGGFDAPALAAREAIVSASGSGHVRARVRDSATVSAVGSAKIDLGGAARCRVTRTGSARVRCGDG